MKYSIVVVEDNAQPSNTFGFWPGGEHFQRFK